MTKLGGCPVCKILGLLLVIGALNWGAIGLMDVNFVEKLLGAYPMVVKIIYILVGLAGVVGIISCVKSCPCCKKP